MIRVLVTCLACFVGQAVAGETLRPLSKVEEIRGPLVAAAIAYEIEQGCPDIERREIRVAIEGWKIAYRAHSLGYSRREIKSYVSNDKEIAKLREAARQNILLAGVALDDASKICAYGDILMRSQSLAGSLLRRR
jgi:hypothetical protein